jgi:hypothetical protein
VFAESPVDLAVIHGLPNLGFAKGGVTDPYRMAELRDRYPGRYLLYATVDTPVADMAIRQLEAQVHLLRLYRDMRRHLIDVLLELPGVDAVDVTLATDIVWTPDRMRPEPPDGPWPRSTASAVRRRSRRWRT